MQHTFKSCIQFIFFLIFITVESVLSLGPLFVDCQNFAGLLGCNFVCNWFVALRCKSAIILLNVRGDVNSWVRVTREIQERYWFNSKPSIKSIWQYMNMYIIVKSQWRPYSRLESRCYIVYDFLNFLTQLLTHLDSDIVWDLSGFKFVSWLVN